MAISVSTSSTKMVQMRVLVALSMLPHVFCDYESGSSAASSAYAKDSTYASEKKSYVNGKETRDFNAEPTYVNPDMDSCACAGYKTCWNYVTLQCVPMSCGSEAYVSLHSDGTELNSPTMPPTVQYDATRVDSIHHDCHCPAGSSRCSHDCLKLGRAGQILFWVVFALMTLFSIIFWNRAQSQLVFASAYLSAFACSVSALGYLAMALGLGMGIRWHDGRFSC